MVYMQRNRKINGAANPDQTASSEASAQKSARQLSPNDYPNQASEDLRFQAKLGTCEAINRAHYEAGISGDGPYTDAYGASIPFVGVQAPAGKDTKLKG